MVDRIFDIPLNNLVSVGGDIVISISLGLIIIAIKAWCRYHPDKTTSTAILDSAAGMLLMLWIRITYWIPGRMLAPEGSYNHPAWFEWRWLMLIIVSTGCLYYSRRLYENIKGPISPLARFGYYAAVVGIAALLAVFT